MAAGDHVHGYGTITSTDTFADGMTWGHYSLPESKDFEKSFGQIISHMLSSKLSQSEKDKFINICMRIKDFREYVSEYFPQYVDKIKLWEKLHPED